MYRIKVPPGGGHGRGRAVYIIYAIVSTGCNMYRYATTRRVARVTALGGEEGTTTAGRHSVVVWWGGVSTGRVLATARHYIYTYDPVWQLWGCI